MNNKKLKIDISDFDYPASDEFKCYQQLCINAKLANTLHKTAGECKAAVNGRVVEIKHQRKLQFDSAMNKLKMELLHNMQPVIPYIDCMKDINRLYLGSQQAIQSLAQMMSLIDDSIIAPVGNFEYCQEHLRSSVDAVNIENRENIRYLLANIEDMKLTVSKTKTVFEECKRMTDSLSNRRKLHFK